jgi:hypothetical protein
VKRSPFWGDAHADQEPCKGNTSSLDDCIGGSLSPARANLWEFSGEILSTSGPYYVNTGLPATSQAQYADLNGMASLTWSSKDSTTAFFGERRSYWRQVKI